MRIRYKDFVLNPLDKTLKIFNFAGIEMNMSIKFWLDEATSTDNAFVYSSSHPQDLHRNVRGVLCLWITKLSFKHVQIIQKDCSAVIKALRYKVYNDSNHLIMTKRCFILIQNGEEKCGPS